MAWLWIWVTCYAIPVLLLSTGEIPGVIFGLMWLICVAVIVIMESNRRFDNWLEVKTWNN